jgi:predicted signal transduction protein with EAL and GGDEF domain
LSISKVYGDNRELTHYIGIYEDITQTKLAQQRIERLAYTDNLTNLGNRPAFIRNLDERFARDATPRSACCWWTSTTSSGSTTASATRPATSC